LAPPLKMDWESRYRLADTPWEKGAAAPPLLGWLKRNPMNGRVLVPGCGSGHDVRAIARAGADPLGMDIAPSAIRRAESFPRAGSETYRLGDFFSLPPEFTGGFDWLFEHTCFCAIDPALRCDYVASAAAGLKPRGKILAIFYRDPGGEDGPPFGVSRGELDALFGDRFECLDEFTPAVAFPGRENRELVRVLQRRD
jgi:methyl halide transferase